MKEYRCTRNASYSHNCIGRDDLTARQGYYIHADSVEEAWQRMAIRFPEEASAGFTVEEWQSFDVRVVELKQDEFGNVVEVKRDKEDYSTEEE